jgi:hypothetical protein
MMSGMSLAVVGAGFGRTGTMSVKLALEMLGLGPCYHMLEVIRHPEHVGFWHEAPDQARPDWERVLGAYRSAVDWPVCNFWQELADEYPDAKVLLTVRDPDAWFASISKTIFEMLVRTDDSTEEARRHRTMVRRLVLHDVFSDRIDDRDHVIAVYEKHNAEVLRVMGDRALAYDARSGWRPLCDFLGVPVPDAPFPKTNTVAEFRQRAHLDPT